MSLPSKKIRRAASRPTSATLAFWALALLASSAAGFFIARRLEDAVFSALFIAILFFIWHKPKFALYATIFLPVIGELYRLNVGPENGALISDLFIPLLIGLWILKKYLNNVFASQTFSHSHARTRSYVKEKFPKSALLKPLLIFVAVAMLSLIQAFLFLKPAEVLMSSFYLVRFTEYALLYLVTADLITTEKAGHRLFAALCFSAVLIAIAGFIQLIIYPDLGRLEQYGWDPHINRLVSTWLDPNFVGGLFAFIITILLSLTVYTKKWMHKIGLLIPAITLSVALFLTYSRSAYLALATGIIIVGLLKSRKLLLICIILFIMGIAVSPRAEERVNDLAGTISSIIFNTAENPDATARLRIQSWEQTLNLIAKRPFLGSGYNTLRYVNFNEGNVSDPQIHSASGSDSSLLTILATTGIFGLIPFLWLNLKILALAWRTSKQKSLGGFARGISFGLFAGLLALMADSLFVNSLLFPQILIFIWVVVGIVHGISRRARDVAH